MTTYTFSIHACARNVSDGEVEELRTEILSIHACARTVSESLPELHRGHHSQSTLVHGLYLPYVRTQNLQTPLNPRLCTDCISKTAQIRAYSVVHFMQSMLRHGCQRLVSDIPHGAKPLSGILSFGLFKCEPTALLCAIGFRTRRG